MPFYFVIISKGEAFMSSLTINNLCKSYYGRIFVVHNLNLNVKDGEFLVLLGSEHSSKSTLLKLIFGLEKPTVGEIHIDDKLVNNIPPNNRNVSLILNNNTLFPNLTVKENIEYPLSIKSTKNAHICIDTINIAKTLGITEILGKKPCELQTYEINRVILARSIINDPSIILIDEAFSNLDAESSKILRDDLIKINKDLGKTIIYATKNSKEAFKLSDNIAIINCGKISQIGHKNDLISSPQTRFISELIFGNKINMVKATICKYNNHFCIDLLGTKLNLPESMDKDILEKYNNKNILMAIRAKDIYCNEQPDFVKSYTLIHTKVKSFRGSLKYYSFEISGSNFIFKAQPGTRFNENEIVDICFDMDKVLLFDKQTNFNIFI